MYGKVHHRIVFKNKTFFKDYLLPDGKSHPMSLIIGDTIYISPERLKEVESELPKELQECPSTLVISHEMTHLRFGFKGSLLDELVVDTFVSDFIRKKYPNYYSDIRKVQHLLVIPANKKI